MPEALSQSQIDELLNKMRSGDMEDIEQEINEEKNREREYDFSSPKKFTKDQLKSLNSLYENFSRVASSYITSIVRDVCEITVVQIEEQRYYEYNNALPDNALVAMIMFQPESNQYDEMMMMMDMSTAFGYSLVDCLLGGSGGMHQINRDYTEIELALLEHTFKNLTHYLKEAWCSYFAANLTMQNIETNGRLLQAFAPQDVVVIVSFEIKTGEVLTQANICMPAENLEKIINSFNIKYSKSVKQPNQEEEVQKRAEMMESLKDSDVMVEALLESCEMDLGSLMNLRVNDVISLNTHISDNITVLVEGTPWCEAKYGKLGSKTAIKVVDTIKT